MEMAESSLRGRLGKTIPSTLVKELRFDFIEHGRVIVEGRFNPRSGQSQYPGNVTVAFTYANYYRVGCKAVATCRG